METQVQGRKKANLKAIVCGFLFTFLLVSCNPIARSGEPTTQAQALQTDTPSPIPATQTYTPIPTETPQPTSTLTNTPTPDPDMVWPEFPTGTPPVLPTEFIDVIHPLPEELYGVSATEHYKPISNSGIVYNYLKGVEVIERDGNVFRIKFRQTFDQDIRIEITKTTGNWVYLSIDTHQLRVRKGTMLEVLPVPIDIEDRIKNHTDMEAESWLDGFWFDPAEMKFFHLEWGKAVVGDTSGTTLTLPEPIYRVYIIGTGNIEILDVYYFAFNHAMDRTEYCEYVYSSQKPWKWDDSSIIHNPWVEGCPNAEILK